MPEKDRIEEIYRLLGMQTPGKAGTSVSAPLSSSLSGGLSRGGLSGGLSAGLNAVDRWPLVFQQYQDQMPQAVKRTGILQQFLMGTGSPVIDTGAKLGMWDKRPEPVNVRETIANLAGTLLGWSIVIGLPGIGKGISAGSAALAGALKGVGVSAKLAGSMGKAMATGGFMGAHRAWAHDRPAGKEILTSMAFAGGVSIAGHGIGMMARKAGLMVPTTEDLIRKQKEILTATDSKTVLAALDKTPTAKLKPAVDKVVEQLQYTAKELPSKMRSNDLGNMAAFKKMTTKQQAEALIELLNTGDNDTLLKPIFDVTRGAQLTSRLLMGRGSEALEQVKGILKSTKAMPFNLSEPQSKVLTAKQKTLWDEFRGAKTLGEQWKIYQNMKNSVESSMRSIMNKHKVTTVEELAKKATAVEVERYVNRHGMLQDMVWAFGNRLDDALGMKIPLPHLKAVPHTPSSKAVVQDLQNLMDKGYDLTGNVHWHPKLNAVMQRWADKTGKSFTHSTLMPKEMAKEWTDTIAALKKAGQPIRTFQHTMATFEVPEHILKKDIPGWITGLKTLPEGSMYLPTNLHDALAAQRDLSPILGRFLTPIRHALGEPFTNSARNRIQLHQTTMNTYMGKLQGIFKESGLRNKDLTNYGVRLGKAMEGRDLPGRTKIDNFVRSFISFDFDEATGLATIKNLPIETKALNAMAKKAGLTVKQMTKLHTDVTNAYKEAVHFAKGNRNLIPKVEDLAFHHYLFQKMKGVNQMSVKSQKEWASMLGLNSEKELKHLYQMRSMFNEIFKDSGIDPDRFILNYVPHMRKFEHLDYKDFLKQLKKIGITDSSLISNYQWVNEMSRQGSFFRYEENLFAAFRKYVSGYSKKKHFDDLFNTWNKVFKDQKLPKERLALYKDLQEWMIGKPGTAEQQFDSMIMRFGNAISKQGWKPEWGERPSQSLSNMLAELQYTGGLGFNPFTAVKNLTQKGLAFSSITDDGNPWHGMSWFFKARAFKKTAEGKYIASLNPVAKNRQFAEGLDAQMGAIETFLNRIGAPNWLKAGNKTFQKEAFRMFRASDMSNVEDTFLAKYLYLAEQKGAPLMDAVNLATNTTMATQFMYGFDSPMLYKSPFGRQLGIFMSWPINWAHMLYNQGTAGEAKQAIAAVGTMAVMSQVLNLTRMNFNSIHPVHTARSILPIAMLQGEDRFPMAFRSGAALTTAIQELVRGDEVAIDAAFDNLKRTLTPMVPAGVMGKRTLDFIDLAKNDWKKYDRRGRLQFESSPIEGLKGWAGPTMEAYERSRSYEQIRSQQGSYRRMRSMAIEAFMEQDYNQFERLQEQLVMNFGRWITPEDIVQETRLRQMSSRERQLMSMPASFSDPYVDFWGR